jgi:multisubunit Na+/H+ antiporter MnhB subunit
MVWASLIFFGVMSIVSVIALVLQLFVTYYAIEIRRDEHADPGKALRNGVLIGCAIVNIYICVTMFLEKWAKLQS